MPTVHRQLRDWSRRRNYIARDAFADALDEELREASDLTPAILLDACRKVRGTRFFRENKLDAEAVAQELSEYLTMPRVRVNLLAVTPDAPTTPRPVGAATLSPPDLFISYYHEDSTFVERLAREVAQAGFTTWYDREGLTAGNNFPDVIQRALTITRKIGVVATPVSLERPWVKTEIRAGHTRENRGEGEILIPLRLQPCRLPLLMASKDWCDFVPGFDGGLQHLLAALRAA